jgi:hypothetical protein
MTGYIYKISTHKTDLVYIGQTRRTLEERFREHIICFERGDDTKLYNAFKKYGIKSFHIEEIESCDTNDLDEREKYWISYFDSYNNGLNSTIGGASRPRFNHEEIAKRLRQCPYPASVSKEFDCCPDIVRQIAQKEKIPVKNAGNETFLKNARPVKQYTKDGKYIRTFNSTADAARHLIDNNLIKSNNQTISGVRSKISDVARGKRKSAYDSVWEYAD